MTVGSVCSGIFLCRRFRKTAATRGRSSGRAVSSSTMDASVTTWRRLRPPCSSAGSSGVITSRKRRTIRATRCAAASGPRGTSYVSGKRYPSRSLASGSRSWMGAGSCAAARKAACGTPLTATSRAMSSRLVPSGKVTTCRTTSPRTSLSMIWSTLMVPVSSYSPARSRPVSPRLRTSRRNTSGWRTRPSCSSRRPMSSTPAPGAMTSGWGGSLARRTGQRVSWNQAP